jgi:hypothetical protein
VDSGVVGAGILSLLQEKWTVMHIKYNVDCCCRPD